MIASVQERQALWDEFLEKWPLERLATMRLEEYTAAGSKEVFQYWIESKCEDLGSMWGGSAFKFGIFSRADKSDKTSGGGLSYSDEYAWYTKYGSTHEQAWQKVQSIVAAVAQAARVGNWQAVEQADFGVVIKWKLAFLYQDRRNPAQLQVLPMYLAQRLRFLADASKHTPVASLHAQLLAQRTPEQSIFEFVDSLQERWDAHAASQFTSEQALEWLKEQETLSLVKEPTAKVAGFRDVLGRELALALDNKKPTLYLSDNGWCTPEIRAQLISLGMKLSTYKESDPRSSNLAANAPALDVGRPVLRINEIGTLQQLETVLNIYTAGETMANEVPAFKQATTAPDTALHTLRVPLNQILFGPPGTGKTYSTINKALEILDPALVSACLADGNEATPQARATLKARFDALCEQGRIRFTTFHQSFSYEDFVEGIRATVDEDNDSAPRFVIEDGIFKRLCDDALQDPEQNKALGVRDDAAVWKISIGELHGDPATREYCLANNEIRVGWEEVGDLTSEDYLKSTALSGHNKNALWSFANAEVGDIVLCFAGNSSISTVGVVTGDYRYEPEVPAKVRKDFVHVRPVNWLLKGLNFSVKALNGNKALVQQTMYQLHRITWPRLSEALQAHGYALGQSGRSAPQPAEPYVLVIDEINRGNVSRIFGELITLLEPSKRAGAPEALSVTLPYSKQPFTVPSNVYIIGTMNTTDRSLAGLDVALRRRFAFEELMPDASLLQGVVVKDGQYSIDIGQMLAVMNERIEALLDREHQLGHAFFMPLRAEGGATLAKLANIFHQSVLPLLQEYFFDDWERIAWVLNDQRKPHALRFVQEHGRPLEALFGGVAAELNQRKRWRLNPEAFEHLGSFAGIVQVQVETADVQSEQTAM